MWARARPRNGVTPIQEFNNLMFLASFSSSGVVSEKYLEISLNNK